MLRKARKDRARDVREGVQSPRTRDWEIGRAEEDTIGGTFFLYGWFPSSPFGVWEILMRAERWISLCFDQRERLPCESESKGSPGCLVREKKETIRFPFSLLIVLSRSRASVFETESESFITMRGERRLQFLKIFARSFHTSVFSTSHSRVYFLY